MMESLSTPWVQDPLQLHQTKDSLSLHAIPIFTLAPWHLGLWRTRFVEPWRWAWHLVAFSHEIGQLPKLMVLFDGIQHVIALQSLCSLLWESDNTFGMNWQFLFTPKAWEYGLSRLDIFARWDALPHLHEEIENRLASRFEKEVSKRKRCRLGKYCARSITYLGLKETNQSPSVQVQWQGNSLEK